MHSKLINLPGKVRSLRLSLSTGLALSLKLLFHGLHTALELLDSLLSLGNQILFIIKFSSCCGKCDKPKCNAESGAIPGKDTVGIIKLKKTKRGKTLTCTNKEEIHGLRRCTGACGLATTEAWTPTLKNSNCKCCKQKETETKSVRLTCDDGTHFVQALKNPTKCECLPCEADFGGRK